MTAHLLHTGDTVLVYRDLGGRLKNKWNDRFDGPFVVTAIEGYNRYLVQRIGSDDTPQSEHIDNLVNAPILPSAVDLKGLSLVTTETTTAPALESEAVRHTPALETRTPSVLKLKPTKKTEKKYEVEYIAGKTDNRFLIKWKGFDVATWEPMTNLDCPKLVRDFERLSQRQRVKLREKTIAADKSHAPLSLICSIHSTATFFNKDLSEYPNGDIIKEICKELHLELSQVLLVWASPDCKTYSRADASNISRGNEYRDHSNIHRSPKALFDEKRFEAIKQDALVVSVLKSFLNAVRTDAGINVIMENPAGSLRLRPFVWIYEMLINLTRHTVDYCAFGADRKKSTDFWCNFLWEPTGDTGDGRCHKEC